MTRREGCLHPRMISRRPLCKKASGTHLGDVVYSVQRREGRGLAAIDSTAGRATPFSSFPGLHEIVFGIPPYSFFMRAIEHKHPALFCLFCSLDKLAECDARIHGRTPIRSLLGRYTPREKISHPVPQFLTKLPQLILSPSVNANPSLAKRTQWMTHHPARSTAVNCRVNPPHSEKPRAGCANITPQNKGKRGTQEGGQIRKDDLRRSHPPPPVHNKLAHQLTTCLHQEHQHKNLQNRRHFNSNQTTKPGEPSP